MGNLFQCQTRQPQQYPREGGKSRSISRGRTMPRTGSSVSFSSSKAQGEKKLNTKKYAFIPDHYTTLEQVTLALKESGLESSNLILGVDFTKSNEWTGKQSFNNRSLHAIGSTPNPYERAIAIIGKTLAPFDEDNLIPCFGFGDGQSCFLPYISILNFWSNVSVQQLTSSTNSRGLEFKFCRHGAEGLEYRNRLWNNISQLIVFLFITVTTHDQEVFSFHNDHTPCHGFEEVLACYRSIVPNLRLSGPTSFGPIVEAAIDIVEKSDGQYHVLVIIADGQVTRSIDIDDAELSPQEKSTINSIVTASSYPLSIVLIGVGDGPWEDMKTFDDKIPSRIFDNFQFVNFTAIMSKNISESEKEAAFALAALMEIPIQYKACMELRLLGHVTGKAKKVTPRPPPVAISMRSRPSRQSSGLEESKSTTQDNSQVCPICLSNAKDLAFGCGHMTCGECGRNLSTCPICRQTIRSRLRVYSG